MSSSVDQDIGRLTQWQRAGRHAEALAEARRLLDGQPDNGELLILAAISLRHLGRFDDALGLLDRLEARRPRFGLMHQERALCHMGRGVFSEAIASLRHALRINPSSPVAWKMLGAVYQRAGDDAAAAGVAARLAELSRLPRPLVIGAALLSDGHLAPAEEMVRGFLRQYGEHPEALRLLAGIAGAHGAADDAARLLEGALRLASDSRAARRDYADALIRLHRYREAGEQVRRLLAMDSHDPDHVSLAASAAMGMGDQQAALALYRALLADRPEAAEVHLWMGHASMMVSKAADAIAFYGRTAILRPDFGDAYWSLANLKRYEFTGDQIARMRAAEAASRIAPTDRYHLCFALGKALEDRDEIAESWRYYERGNSLKSAESHYRPEVVEANTRAQIEICTQAFFAQRKGWGDPVPDPIFILGLPRSGSTLIEQILASHSQVEGTQELSDIEAIVLDLLPGREPNLDAPRYPGVLAGLTASQFRGLGEAYLRNTRPHRVLGRSFFIDKMPSNFCHIGLIHLMLPNAKIIDARREPMACCFSNFKQLFAYGQDATYSIEGMARYYRTYLELMRHWDAVLPGRVLRVHHEDVVDDLDGSVRRILDHCGLAFEPGCVEFHKTERTIRTPSAEQVRQPIFRDGLDQWKKFEPWLGPLKEALGDAVIRYRR